MHEMLETLDRSELSTFLAALPCPLTTLNSLLLWAVGYGWSTQPAAAASALPFLSHSNQLLFRNLESRPDGQQTFELAQGLVAGFLFSSFSPRPSPFCPEGLRQEKKEKKTQEKRTR
jgi:hypothetical protein